MKKWLSYFWPITTRRKTRYSGMVELTWQDGRILLNSRNANYSYGTLQEILEYGLRKLDLSFVNTVCLLGLGGGSVIDSLRRKFRYNGPITAVEIDPDMLDIAREVFAHSESGQLRLIQADAWEWMLENTEQFDLVIVDLFIDDRIPLPFLQVGFCQALHRALHPPGALIFNLGMDPNGSSERDRVCDYFKTLPGFRVNIMEKVNGTNRLLIAQQVPAVL